LSMDLTAGRTVGPTVDSTVGWTVGLTVKLCNIGLTVDPTVEIIVSQTQANDASGRLPRYEAKYVKRTRFQWRVSPFAFRYQGNGATPCQYIDTTRKVIDCATTVPLTVFI